MSCVRLGTAILAPASRRARLYLRAQLGEHIGVRFASKVQASYDSFQAVEIGHQCRTSMRTKRRSDGLDAILQGLAHDEWRDGRGCILNCVQQTFHDQRTAVSLPGDANPSILVDQCDGLQDRKSTRLNS